MSNARHHRPRQIDADEMDTSRQQRLGDAPSADANLQRTRIFAHQLNGERRNLVGDVRRHAARLVVEVGSTVERHRCVGHIEFRM